MSFFMLLVTLTALIFVHEVGHLVAARLIGVRVRTISIGFGGVCTAIKIEQAHYGSYLFSL